MNGTIHSVLLIVLCVLQVILAMLMHECGHIIAALSHRVPVKKIGIGWMGMYIQRARTMGWPEISICLAGAAANLSIAIAFRADHWFALCNFSFAWVNLLPIQHSDGRHALEAWRELRWRKLVDSTWTRRQHNDAAI